MERREQLGTRARVAPSVLAAHLDWCRKELGASAPAQVVARLFPDAARMVGGPAADWLPFWALVAADRAIASLAPQPEGVVYHELGRHSATLNWTEPYRAFSGDEPHRFFEKTVLWHDVFQDFGTAGYERIGLHAGHFTIEGSDEYSPVFCASALGYFEGALQMMGAPGPFDGEETLCRCAGDPACVFALHW